MLPHIFVRMGVLTQATRQGLSAKIRFAKANTIPRPFAFQGLGIVSFGSAAASSQLRIRVLLLLVQMTSRVTLLWRLPVLLCSASLSGMDGG